MDFPKWLVTYETKAQCEKEWTTVVAKFEKENHAHQFASDISPPPCGSFGPRQYRSIMVSKVRRVIEDN